MPSSRGSSRPKGRTHVSYALEVQADRFFTSNTSWEALHCWAAFFQIHFRVILSWRKFNNDLCSVRDKNSDYFYRNGDAFVNEGTGLTDPPFIQSF